MPRIKQFTIDISDICEYDKDETTIVIREALRRRQLSGPDFLYSVCDGERADVLKREGTYRASKHHPNRIYAFTWDKLVWDNPHDYRNCIKRFAVDEYWATEHIPTIAVFRRRLFRKVSTYEYDFLDPDNRPAALAGVALLQLQTQ